MSRTIFGAALGLWLGVAVGCGSKPEPPPSVPMTDATPTPKGDAPKGDTPPPPPKGDTTAPAPAAPSGPEWEMDLAKHAIPNAPVKGRISGADATPEVAVSSTDITFRVPKAGSPQPERSVTIKLAPHAPGQPVKPVPGQSWKVKDSDAPGPTVPEIWQEVHGQPVLLHPNGYALTLELAARKDGKVSGRVYLSLGDKDKSVLAGTFNADYFRFHTEPLGPDDVPYAAGTVTVTNAKPDAEIRVAYAGFAGGMVLFKELQLGFDPMPEETARWQPDESDKPRVSRLIAGDGKGRAFRYEHARLAPGRYLMTAGVVGGPAVWKWVDVAAGATMTENFALDASQVGGIEVSVPADAKGKLYAAPADAPDRPALAADQFLVIASQTRLDADIVAGKASLKNLAPGKYEVRFGDLRGFADVTVGKTAELALAPAKK